LRRQKKDSTKEKNYPPRTLWIGKMTDSPVRQKGKKKKSSSGWAHGGQKQGGKGVEQRRKQLRLLTKAGTTKQR